MPAERRADLDDKAADGARRYAAGEVTLRRLADEWGCSVGAVRTRIVGNSVEIRGRSEPRGIR